MLQLKTIHADTFRLLQKLSANEFLRAFALAGGNSLALQLGHRISMDLVFLSVQAFDSNVLLEMLDAQFDIENGATGQNSAALFINYKNTSIKTDFLRHNYSLLKPINTLEGVNIYSLEDIAAMKLTFELAWNTMKDFLTYKGLTDIYGS